MICIDHAYYWRPVRPGRVIVRMSESVVSQLKLTYVCFMRRLDEQTDVSVE